MESNRKNMSVIVNEAEKYLESLLLSSYNPLSGHGRPGGEARTALMASEVMSAIDGIIIEASRSGYISKVKGRQDYDSSELPPTIARLRRMLKRDYSPAGSLLWTDVTRHLTHAKFEATKMPLPLLQPLPA